MDSRVIPILGALTLVAGGLLGGCARSAFERPLDTTYDSRQIGGQLDFLHGLEGRSGVTNDEAMHGVLLLADGIDPTNSYEARVTELQSRRWLRSGFGEPANMLVQRGTLATMIANAIDLEGGVMYTATFKHPRYANRELVYRGIMQPGSENQVVSGLQFLTILGRSEDFLRARAVRAMLREAEGHAGGEIEGLGTESPAGTNGTREPSPSEDPGQSGADGAPDAGDEGSVGQSPQGEL